MEKREKNDRESVIEMIGDMGVRVREEEKKRLLMWYE